MKTQNVDLFAIEEHVILADWLGVEPLTSGNRLPDPSEALEALGFADRATGYSETDAAVASLVLERIQDRLPQWGAVKWRQDDGEQADVLLARAIKARTARRKVELVPRYLLTINWADSGPGFSWPVAYHVTWVPLYERYIVTQSADCPDAFGYCDFAIGQFEQASDFVSAAIEEIEADWGRQRGQWSQSNWVGLFGTGLIDEETAFRMREAVWADETD